jgi:hypothetical protein
LADRNLADEGSAARRDVDVGRRGREGGSNCSDASLGLLRVED